MTLILELSSIRTIPGRGNRGFGRSDWEKCAALGEFYRELCDIPHSVGLVGGRITVNRAQNWVQLGGLSNFYNHYTPTERALNKRYGETSRIDLAPRVIKNSI